MGKVFAAPHPQMPARRVSASETDASFLKAAIFHIILLLYTKPKDTIPPTKP